MALDQSKVQACMLALGMAAGNRLLPQAVRDAMTQTAAMLDELARAVCELEQARRDEAITLQPFTMVEGSDHGR